MNSVKHPILLFMLLCLIMVYPQIAGKTASQNTIYTEFIFHKKEAISKTKKEIIDLKDSLLKEGQKLKKNIIVLIKQQDTLKKYNVKTNKQ